MAFWNPSVFLCYPFGLQKHRISRPLPEMTMMKPYVAKENKDIIVYSLMLSPKGNENGFHKWSLILLVTLFYVTVHLNDRE